MKSIRPGFGLHPKYYQEILGKIAISNIEKKVREEIDTLSEKLKSTDFEGVKKGLKSNGNKLKDSFGDILGSIINLLAKVVGAFMIAISIALLVIFLIGVLAFGTTNFPNFPFHSFIELGNFTDYPVWFFGLLFYLAVSIPSIFVLLLGITFINKFYKFASTDLPKSDKDFCKRFKSFKLVFILLKCDISNTSIMYFKYLSLRIMFITISYHMKTLFIHN